MSDVFSGALDDGMDVDNELGDLLFDTSGELLNYIADDSSPVEALEAQVLPQNEREQVPTLLNLFN